MAPPTLVGHSSIKGNSEMVQMVLLTFCNIGITFVWGMEMTYCTPYLLNLGLTKSNTSLVWIAGPLSGLLVQPIIGVIADESTSRWGRRRPLMVIGAAVVVISLLVLGFTKELVGMLVVEEERARRPTIVLAVLAIYVVDFAINAVMSCARGLIVDTLPIEKQQAGAAWASRTSAVGHLIAYGAGAIDLVSILGTGLGDTQFKQLTVIAAFAILASTALTCWAVTERVLVSTGQPIRSGGRLKIFQHIVSTVRNLPPRIRAICWAQFWSWIGWFPFLFYSTTWVGETYFRYDLPADAKQSKDTLGDMGRIGSTSLVIYSCVTFAGAFFLPLLVKSPGDDSFTHRPPQAVAGLLARFKEMQPDLLTVWIYGHLMFSAAMAMAPLARSFVSATILVCLCGIPWDIAMWAPAAFLGIEVNKMGGDDNIRLPNRRPSNHELQAPRSLQPSPDDLGNESGGGEQSGIYFGILNIFTTLPQFLGTFIATIVFTIMEPGQSSELMGDERKHQDGETASGGTNAIAVCLFIGAMSTLVAAHMTRKLRKL